MIGIIVGILFSGLLLHFIEKKSILVLGFLPFEKRATQFLIGFAFTGILCVLAQYLESYLKSSVWILNEKSTETMILKSFWWDFKSVLTEELIFRGALLYILIQKIGAKKSILISATAFGVYHWFSYGVLGNPVAMILIFIGTGLMGYAWALAFSKTKSMMLAFGFHLGWNFVYNSIFSKGPLGDSFLIAQGGTKLTDLSSLLNFTSGLIIVPVLVLIYVQSFVKEERG